MKKKKKTRAKVTPPALPLPLPLPLSGQKKKTKKKVSEKKSAARYHVLEYNTFNVEAFKTLEDALEYINTDLLPHYMGEIPTPNHIIIVYGEQIPFEYESKVKAQRLSVPK